MVVVVFLCVCLTQSATDYVNTDTVTRNNLTYIFGKVFGEMWKEHAVERKMIHCRERPNFHFITHVLSVLLGLFLAYVNFSFYLSFFPNFLEVKKKKTKKKLESLPQSNSLSVLHKI